MTAPIRVESIVGEYSEGSEVGFLIEHEVREPTRHAAPCVRWLNRCRGILVVIRSHVMFWTHKVLPKATLAIGEVYALGCDDR